MNPQDAEIWLVESQISKAYDWLNLPAQETWLAEILQRLSFWLFVSSLCLRQCIFEVW